MTEQELQRIVDTAADNLLMDNGEIDRRYLRSILKEVDREARSLAAKTAFQAANSISAGEDIARKLDRLEMLERVRPLSNQE